MRHLPLLALLAAACVPAEQASDDTDDTDVGPTCAYERPDRPAPGALQAGLAKARIPAPVGIGTAGFGPFGAPSNPTPFASIYPGTRRIHGHPEIKAVALSRGPGNEVVFVRLDAVGVFHQLRTDIVNRVSERLGRDMDDAIVLGATHTHSGPGRVVNTNMAETSFFDFIADKFMPEFYDRFVGAVADTIVAAYDDLQPAEVAFVDGNCPDGHSDRRCEDGEYQNGTLPIVAVRRDGRLDALVHAYAAHGTVFGIDDQYLSQDVHGAIEEAVEDRFDHPVESLSFNAWGADMAPGSPQGVPHAEVASTVDGNHVRFRDVGWTVANAVEDALATATWTSDPEIHLETHRLTIDREAIGYTDEDFPYEFGAVYCQSTEQSNLEDECAVPEGGFDDLLAACVPFNESFPAPNDTITTVGRIGDYGFVSWPGEPGTLLVEALLQRIREANGVERFFFAGYAQDYLGYSLLEEDWWKGGYEASGALWGPKQGQFISDRIVEIYDSFANGTCPPDEPEALQPFPYSLDQAYTAEKALDLGTVAEDVQGAYLRDGVVTFTVYGSDPWVGAPLAWLEDDDGNALLRPNGMRVDSDDYNFDVDLSVDPSYPDQPRGDRHFAWTFTFPLAQPVEGNLAVPDGTWTLKVQLPKSDGSTTTVSSAPFAVGTAE
jgi:hypothetical protein